MDQLREQRVNCLAGSDERYRSMNCAVQRQSVAVGAILQNSQIIRLFVSFDLRENPPQPSRHTQTR